MKLFGRDLKVSFSLIFVISSLATVIVLSGCGGSEKRVAKDSQGREIVRVWETYSPTESKVFAEIVARFEKINPGIKIEVNSIPWMSHKEKVRTALTVGNPPDICRVAPDFIPELVENHVLANLDKLGADKIRDQYPAPALVTNMVEGALFGLPDQVNGVCLFYNREMFRKAGLDPDKAPETWEQFIEYGKKLTIKSEEQYGFGMDNSLWWTFPFFNTFGAEYLSEDRKKCLLDSPEAIAALQLKVDLYRKHKIEGGAWISGAIAPDAGFQNNRYAMVFMGPWNLKRYKEAKIDFGVSLIPKGPKGSATNMGGTNMVVFENSTVKQHAFNFLSFLTSPEQQAYWSSELGQIPVNINAAKHMNVDDPAIKTFIEQMKTAVPIPQVPKGEMVEQDVFNPEMAAALNGDKTVEEALKNAVKRMNTEILGN